jgi:hypothetical protein
MIGSPVMFAGVDCFSGPFVANGAPASDKEFEFHVKMDRTSGGQLPKAKSDFQSYER